MLQDFLDSGLAGGSAGYLIAVVRFDGDGVDCSALEEAAGPDVPAVRLDHDVVLLVPDLDAARTERVIERLTCCLDGRGRLVTTRRPATDLVQGVAEAADVMRLVVAGRRPSGAYTISDVLVEYAATRHPRVIETLRAVIEPLREHAVLWETLTAVIDADHDRNEAARRLSVDRTTIDHRVERIAELTGHHPATGRGAQLLTTALIAHAIHG